MKRELCPTCEEFDRVMNRSGGISLDVWVQCDHIKPEKEPHENQELQANQQGINHRSDGCIH
jgi:Zn ribbon nucleic-acid-binding protein